jgi:hypothetical protein
MPPRLDVPNDGRRRNALTTALLERFHREAAVAALVPTERSFLQAQGLVIVAMAGVTGFAVTVAGSGWWDVPITQLLWLGIVWTAVICVIDRLIYKSFGTSRVGNLMLAVPRAALSVMLALVLGLPMVQFIFAPSISKQLTQTSAVEQKEARQASIAFYEPRIKAVTAQIAAIEKHEITLQQRVSTFTRLSRCENDDPSCAGTGVATTRRRRASLAPHSSVIDP